MKCLRSTAREQVKSESGDMTTAHFNKWGGRRILGAESMHNSRPVSISPKVFSFQFSQQAIFVGHQKNLLYIALEMSQELRQ